MKFVQLKTGAAESPYIPITCEEVSMENRRVSTLAAIVTIGIMLFSGHTLAQTTTDSITATARFVATPGREAELEARLLKNVEFVRKAEPGHIYQLLRSKKDPSAFFLYQVYPSLAALEHHNKVITPASQKENGPLPEGILARPPEFERFQALTE